MDRPTQQRLLAIIEDTLDLKLEKIISDTKDIDSVETFTHAVCQTVIHQRISWLVTLPEDENRKIRTVIMCLLEDEVLNQFYRECLDVDGHKKVSSLPLGDIPQDVPPQLQDLWQDYFWPHRDLAGMAAHTLARLRHGPMIYHILTGKAWEKAEIEGTYAPDSLEVEGFIHCSLIDQVTRSANLFFKGEEDIHLLWIAAQRVRAEIRNEDLAGEGMLFPHIYGELNLDAVVYFTAMPADAKGYFGLPGDIAGLER